MSLGGENRLCYLEDLIEMLASAGVLIGHHSMVNTSETVDEILGLCDKDEAGYFRAVNQDTTYQPADGLIHQFEKDFRSVLGIMQKTTLNTYSMIDNSANTSAAR